jgi:hypothetical protein
MSGLRRTKFKLEFRMAEWSLQHIDEHSALLRQIQGVESIEVELLPQWLRFNLAINIAARSSKQLRSVYHEVATLANVPPFVMTGRRTSPTELFDH